MTGFTTEVTASMGHSGHILSKKFFWKNLNWPNMPIKKAIVGNSDARIVRIGSPVVLAVPSCLISLSVSIILVIISISV